MKRKTAKEILAESFREVAETKSIDKITIRDIVDNCGYSPATFYRQFSYKYDLIAWDYVARTTVIIDKVGVDAYQWKHTWADSLQSVLDEMRPIRYVEHPNTKPTITSFVGDQVKICEAFGFEIPDGCAPEYVVRKTNKGKRGRPRKNKLVVKEEN